MERFISYKILPEQKLIVEYMYGKINPDETIKFKEFESNDPLFSKSYNVLCNIQELLPDNALMKETDLKSDMHFKELIPQKGKLAVITGSPNQVVEAALLQKSIGEINLKVGIYSTVRAACRFLNVYIEDDGLIIETLNELKTSTINRYYIK